MSGSPTELAPILDALRAGGFYVDVVEHGREVLAVERLRRHGAILADDALCDMSVLALVQQVRLRTDMPVIVVTASNVEDHVVALLDAGADQCATKPVRSRELVARVRAAIRRAPRPPDEPAVIEINGVRLDPVGRVVTVGESEVRLTNKEFELLHLLMANAGQTLPRQLIVDRVWGPDAPAGKTLDTLIRRLRTKIGDNPKAPKRIATLHKVGYRYQRSSRR